MGWLSSNPGILYLHNTATGIIPNTTEQPVAIEGASRPLVTSWHRTEANGAEAGDAMNTACAVAVPPNDACWLDASAGGADDDNPR